MNDFRDTEDNSAKNEAWKQDGQRSHVWTGLFLLVIGGLALAKSFGVFIPDWLFSWQMLLIAIGLFIGIKKGFRDGGWFVPIIIGVAFLINDYVILGDLRRHIWPLILIVLGVAFIFRPKSKRMQGCASRRPRRPQPFGGNPNINAVGQAGTPSALYDHSDNISDDYIDATHIFSGSKKIILSKDFRGGELVNIFGGCEIDLTQADLTAPATLDVTAIFGGATLLVPSNWAIQSEAVTIFGGISDRRKMSIMTDGPKKVLILKGTMLFGGMEIKSY